MRMRIQLTKDIQQINNKIITMPFPLSSYNIYDIVAIIFSYVDMGVPKYLVEYLVGGTRIPRIFGRGYQNS